MTPILDGAMSPSLRLETKTVQRLAAIVNTPRALTVYLLIQAGEWEQLIGLDTDPLNYQDVSNFADDYLVSEILKKSPNIPLGVDRVERALDAFYSAELQCLESNERMLTAKPPSWEVRFRREIARILGPLTSDVLESIVDNAKHGPGASTGVRGVSSTISDKFDNKLHLTESLIPFFRSILGERWWEHQRSFKQVVVGNKFTSVPKNAKTDRGICVEPTLNMYVQLGVGAVLRRRLGYFGVDLNTQEHNQRLAARAHKDGLATIDLAQASDTVCWGLLFRFFPERWQELFFLLRSEFTTLLDGRVIELEKISSMGNGFTFELESLIFSALVRTFVPEDELYDTAVFGDDIILPSGYAQSLIDALSFLGLRVNATKSFLAGSFFESCGADYFHGVNVRPFYLRGAKEGIPYALQIANALRVYSRRRCGGHFCDSRFRPVWSSLVAKLPSTWRRCQVPIEFGDCGLISAESELPKARKPKGGHEGRLVSFVVRRLIRADKKTDGVIFASLNKKYRSVQGIWMKVHDSSYHDMGWFATANRSSLVVPNALFSYGRETKRGLFGRPVTKVTVVSQWSQGLDWI